MNDGRLGVDRLAYEMCPIHADFKHFHTSKAKDFQLRGKVSSIMSAKVLSIMRTNAGRVTFD